MTMAAFNSSLNEIESTNCIKLKKLSTRLVWPSLRQNFPQIEATKAKNQLFF